MQKLTEFLKPAGRVKSDETGNRDTETEEKRGTGDDVRQTFGRLLKPSKTERHGERFSERRGQGWRYQPYHRCPVPTPPTVDPPFPWLTTYIRFAQRLKVTGPNLIRLFVSTLNTWDVQK